MDYRWLQIKGDPSVRSQVFNQTRQTSLFDENIDKLMGIVQELLSTRGVFHAMIHFSSNQLTCWTYDDPYNYRVYVGEEIFEPSFLAQFDAMVGIEQVSIPAETTPLILQELSRLRFNDANFYLRNASVNRVNGIISMTFSCDGSHYIPHSEFFETVQYFQGE